MPVNGVDVVLVAALAKDGVIGNGGALPFRLPSDLKRFKALTLGHPVIMGRLTHESIGRALPGRPNLVLSGAPDFRADGCEVYPDVDTALHRGAQLAAGLGKTALFVIGGGQVYAQAIDLADRLEITHVDLAVEGDAHFPPIDPDLWHLETSQNAEPADGDEAAMMFATYSRKAG